MVVASNFIYVPYSREIFEGINFSEISNITKISENPKASYLIEVNQVFKNINLMILFLKI